MKSYLTFIFDDPDAVYTLLDNSFQYKDHYHNITHSIHFMQNVWDGFQHYELTCPRWLLVAALCHDAGHLQSKSITDMDNIKISQQFVKAHQSLLGLSNDDVLAAQYYIGLTQFPRPKAGSCLEEQIFMDADFLEIRHPEWKEQFQYLANEDADKTGKERICKDNYKSDEIFLTTMAPIQTSWARGCIQKWALSLEGQVSCINF